ncbi:MAG: RAMP superfamily CRISPR-associated protein [Cyanobacteria bacterium P01_F01_bin.143]
MAKIIDAYKKVPLMFQAQTNGRCQLNYIDKEKEQQDAEFWTSEWVEKAEPKAPKFDQKIQSKTYQISWRFVTNGGQDDGIIRPVIGAKGWPYYPGSSMKGAFRQACQKLYPEKVAYYCGSEEQPAKLRFHGAYPIDKSWQDQDRLVDLVHPQQGWQVKTDQTRQKPSGESAFTLISLFEPKLQFGISSTVASDRIDWEQVWKIWDRAISSGIGCRVSAGYGQPVQQKDNVIYRAYLKGQGRAAELLSGESEFRPNIFKAAIRGHALRIFGGLTNEKTSDRLVEQLFGGVIGNGSVGLLAVNWRNTAKPELNIFEDGYDEPTYFVKGILRWLVTRSLASEEKKALTKLVKALMRFAMLLGGFGKSWRRIDHRLFYDQYYEGRKTKPLIGCHWQWQKESLERNPDNLVRRLEKVGQAIEQIITTAQEWMRLQNIEPRSPAQWREAWHSDNVQVWGRLASDRDESEAVKWFHGAYRPAIREIDQAEGSIYRTSLTGQIGQISRMWHRMYPVIRLQKDPDNPRKPIVRPTAQYFELLTIFPDDSPDSREFMAFLRSQPEGFQQLWPLVE